MLPLINTLKQQHWQQTTYGPLNHETHLRVELLDLRILVKCLNISPALEVPP